MGNPLSAILRIPCGSSPSIFTVAPKSLFELRRAENLYILKSNLKSNALLEQSRMQEEELRSQEEEMRQHLEELSATQEDFLRREQELKDTIEELESKLSKKDSR